MRFSTKTLSRREALTVLLGAPVAYQACRRPRRSFAGRIRGGSHAVGHRLRDATIERASGEPERVRVAIVGAGPSGLSAAWRLEQLGEQDYVVLDLEPVAGGTSAFGTDAVVPYPWGAHYVPMPSADNPALIKLLGEAGALETQAGKPIAKETLRIREPAERLFISGRWTSGLYPRLGASRQDLSELERFDDEVARWVNERDARGRRPFTIPVAECSDDAAFVELDRTSAADYLRSRGYRSKRLSWYLEYACRDDYGLGLEETSAWALLFYFAARMSKPGKASAPFVAWPEGNGRLVQHLSRAAGRRVRLGSLVTDVAPGPDGVELGVYRVADQTLARYSADYVILAVPKFVVPKILRPFRERPPSYLSEFSYSSWLVANLHLRSTPPSTGFPVAWDNVLYDSPSLGYVVATHQTRRDYGPTVWTYYHPFWQDAPRDARQKLLALEHDTICESIVVDLGRAHRGFDKHIDRIDVYKWGHAMIRPTPGFVWGSARRRAAEPLGRVHFAHSDLSGVALFEEAQYQGVRAAEAISKAEGRDVESLL